MPFLGTTPTQGFVSAVTKQSFTPNGSTTVFTLSHSVANENDLEVFVGNVRQEPGSGKAYTAAGTTLTMSEAVASGVNFYVIFKNKAQVTTTPPVNSVSTDKITDDAVTGAKIENNPTIAGNLTVSGNTTASGTLGVTGVSTLSGNVGVGAAPNNHGGMTRVLEISGSADVQLALHATSDSLADNARIGEVAFMGGSDSTTPILSAIVGRTSGTSEASGQLSFHTRGTDSAGLPTERMRIDQNGHVTMPTQPAFHVHKNGTSNNQNDFAAGDNTITWLAERFDQNSDFDLSNNRFVAPVTGKYFLNIHVRLVNLDTAAVYYAIAISTSNQYYSFIVDPDYFDSDAVYYSIGYSVLADMDANDTAFIQLSTSGGTAQADMDGRNDYTWFSGHLVC